MKPRPDDHVRVQLGALVLGHLGPDEAVAVRAHLEGCAACRQEASELAPLADLLPLVDAGRIDHPPESGPSSELLEEVLTRIEHERSAFHRGRRRAVAARVGAVAAAAVLALVLVVVTVSPDPEEAPSGQVVAMSAADPGTTGEAVIHEDPRSTWVELTVSGLETGETYAVWFEESGSGARSALGTFVGVEGDLYISLYSPLPRDRVASVGVSTPDGSTLLEGVVLAAAG